MKLRVSMAALTGVLLAGCAQTVTEPEAEEAVVDVAEVAEEAAPPLCEGFGPQTPRDITQIAGTNDVMFELAPSSKELNLCNIHTHTNAEHKGPGFAVFAGATDDGGWKCNETADLTAAELAPAQGAYEGVTPGDTIEVHWVHSSCPVSPGPTLGACLSDGCDNPFLRVEAQTFLVVNDPAALDFTDYDYKNRTVNGFHQANMIPDDTGAPVIFRGSTTGPSYTEAVCSPLQVTWSVRPTCAKVDINSLHRWAEDNDFNETKSHGVRQLVTSEPLLSPISAQEQ
ncbi:MAG: delta-class carbonic anhydrase [Pseudomonadota bacterium]